jgi:hypothetical protein
MPPRLLDFLNKPKYKILFYVYRFGKIDKTNSRAKIARSFEYASDGHFYPDFDDLLNQYLIIEKSDGYYLGKEGRKELLFYYAIELGLFVSIAFTILFLYYYYLSLHGVDLSSITYLFIALYLLVLAYLFYQTRKILTPRLPKNIDTLKNRGIMQKIMSYFSKK